MNGTLGSSCAYSMLHEGAGQEGEGEVMKLPDLLLEPIVQVALREDIRSGDITTTALVPEGARARASLNFRQAGVLCGSDVAQCAFRTLDPATVFSAAVGDGGNVEAGRCVLV